MKSTRTNKTIPRLHPLVPFFLILAVSAIPFVGAEANAQYTELISGLREPNGVILNNQGNLIVLETGRTDLRSV